MLAMAGGTEAFASGFAPALSTSARFSSHALSSCRQAPGRMASLSGLHMVASTPVSFAHTTANRAALSVV